LSFSIFFVYHIHDSNTRTRIFHLGEEKKKKLTNIYDSVSGMKAKRKRGEKNGHKFLWGLLLLAILFCLFFIWSLSDMPFKGHITYCTNVKTEPTHRYKHIRCEDDGKKVFCFSSSLFSKIRRARFFVLEFFGAKADGRKSIIVLPNFETYSASVP
jgi:hypothetical protein